jgi:hypothetical protein
LLIKSDIAVAKLNWARVQNVLNRSMITTEWDDSVKVWG